MLFGCFSTSSGSSLVAGIAFGALAGLALPMAAQATVVGFSGSGTGLASVRRVVGMGGRTKQYPILRCFFQLLLLFPAHATKPGRRVGDQPVDGCGSEIPNTQSLLHSNGSWPTGNDHRR